MAGPPDRVAEANQAAVALFAAIVALLVAAIGFLLRFGYPNNSPLEWAKYVGLSWFLLSFSLIARRFLAVVVGTGPLGHWWASHAFLTMLGLALACGIGTASMAGTVTGSIFCWIGAAGVALALATQVGGGRLRGTAILCAFAGLFSIYAAGAAWGTGDRNPLFVEDLSFGRAPIDTLFHASICNMLRTYGVPSTGLDGLPYVPYHFGSHWIFARLCNLLDVRVIDFYNRGYPILFIPFGVLSLGSAGLALSQRRRRPAESATAELIAGRETQHVGAMFWLIVAVGYIGFLPYASNFMPINGWNSIVTSESYALGVAVSLLVVAAVWAFIGDVFSFASRSRAIDLVVGALLAVVLVGVLGLLKISVMIVLVAAAGYLALRLGLIRSIGLDLLGLAVVLIAAFAYRAAADPGYFALGESRFVAFGFPRANIEPQWWPEFWLIYYAWLWVLAAARLRQEGIRTLGELTAAWRTRKLLDLEFVVVAAVVGAGPGLFMKYSSTHYFSNYQQWPAMAFLLAMTVRCVPSSQQPSDESNRRAQRWRLGDLNLSRVFAGLLLLTLGGTLVANTAVLSGAMIASNLAARGHASGQTGIGVALMHGQFDAAATILKQSAAEVESRLNADKRILAVLSSLDRLPLAEKRRTLLYIPKSNRQFWDLLHGPYWPKEGPLVGPALSGLAMIDGLYVPGKDDPWIGHGYNRYPRPNETQALPPLSQELPALRRRGAEMGFRQLIVIDTDSLGMPIRRDFACP
jgi:hypothetical protein